MNLIFDKPWGPDQDGYGPMKLGCRAQLSRRCWSYRWIQLHLKAQIRNQRAAGGGKSHKFPGSDDLAKPHKPEGRGRLGGSSGLARSLGFPLRYLHEDREQGKRRGSAPKGRARPHPLFCLGGNYAFPSPRPQVEADRGPSGPSAQGCSTAPGKRACRVLRRTQAWPRAGKAGSPGSASSPRPGSREDARRGRLEKPPVPGGPRSERDDSEGSFPSFPKRLGRAPRAEPGPAGGQARAHVREPEPPPPREPEPPAPP